MQKEQSRKVRLRAARGRVVVKFPPAVERTEGGIHISEGSQMRLEMAEIVDVGEPVTADEVEHCRWLLERQAKGELVLVSFEAGVGFWKQNYDPKKWSWLKDYRAYHVSQPTTCFEFTEPDLVVTDPSIVLVTH